MWLTALGIVGRRYLQQGLPRLVFAGGASFDSVGDGDTGADDYEGGKRSKIVYRSNRE